MDPVDALLRRGRRASAARGSCSKLKMLSKKFLNSPCTVEKAVARAAQTSSRCSCGALTCLSCLPDALVPSGRPSAPPC